jgi:biofilm PGA synthesis protein PgaD
VANGALYHLNHSVVVAIMPVVKTLMVYLTIAAFNALVLVLWASHHKLNSGRRPQLQVTQALPDGNALALRFALSHNELREVQDSQVTIIHLSDNGGITHLETDQLRAEPPDRQGLEHARVA